VVNLTVSIKLEDVKKERVKPLSFTDCTSLALIENSRIKRIMSFDVASTG